VPRDRLAATALGERLSRSAGIDCVEPLAYGDLLTALAGSQVVVTDSGGIQEEAAWLGVPAIVLRASTPRPEGIELGLAHLSGVDCSAAAALVERLVVPSEQRRIAALGCPYGDGRASHRIVGAIAGAFGAGRLDLREPQLGVPVACAHGSVTDLGCERSV
jgi:UDP-N-acetylglucosamine 2-epimerase (non-hydrolysing)